MGEQKPTDRLNYQGDLAPIVSRVCTAYGIGTLNTFDLIEVGYEDCNVVLETDRGKFLAKMFAKFRTEADIARYTAVMRKVVNVGVHHPELFTTGAGNNVYRDSGIALVLMKFVQGSTFFELNRAPNANERIALVEQVAKVNAIDYQPPYLFDSWAIPNIRSTFAKVEQFVEPSDAKLVEHVIARYEAVPIRDLPHTFVHGDCTKANVVKSSDEEIYILDFSVANWYPRIQELAVIAANLMHDENSSEPLESRCQQIAAEYSQFSPLTDEELQYLPPYALAAVAMEFIGAHQEKYLNGNDTEETEYWLKLGREGLRS